MKTLKNISLIVLVLSFIACESTISPWVPDVDKPNHAIIKGTPQSVLTNATPKYSVGVFNTHKVYNTGENVNEEMITGSVKHGVEGRISIYFERERLQEWNDVYRNKVRVTISRSNGRWYLVKFEQIIHR